MLPRASTYLILLCCPSIELLTSLVNREVEPRASPSGSEYFGHVIPELPLFFFGAAAKIHKYFRARLTHPHTKNDSLKSRVFLFRGRSSAYDTIHPEIISHPSTPSPSSSQMLPHDTSEDQTMPNEALSIRLCIVFPAHIFIRGV
jgi:hypothetical protein